MHREDSFSLLFFLPSSFSCASDSSFISNSFPFRSCLLTASFLLKSGAHQRLCTEESKASLANLLQGCAQGVRGGIEGYSKARSAILAGQRLGTCLRCPTILCYFDSCHLKENKTAAVIRIRQKLSSFLLNNGRVLADLLQPLMPASLMILRPLPQLLPTRCRGIQLPALFPFHGQKTAAFHTGRNVKVELKDSSQLETC